MLSKLYYLDYTRHTLLYSLYNLARIEARNTRRKADLKQISLALDLNFDEHNAYTQPESICTDTSYGALGSCGGAGGSGDWDANSDLRDLVSDGFMNKLPIDPINDATYKYVYEPYNAGEIGYNTAGQAYTLCATLEGGGSFCLNKKY